MYDKTATTHTYTQRRKSFVEGTLVTTNNFNTVAERFGCEIVTPVSFERGSDPRMLITVYGALGTNRVNVRPQHVIVRRNGQVVDVVHAEVFDDEWELVNPVVGYSPDMNNEGMFEIVDILLRAGLTGATLSGPYGLREEAWNVVSGGFLVQPLTGANRYLVSFVRASDETDRSDPVTLGAVLRAALGTAYEVRESTRQGHVVTLRP